MKRVFDEISNDEWNNHDFKPSRVLNTTTRQQRQSPPPIESFAFRKSSRRQILDSDSGSDDCVEIANPSGLAEENLEDDDVDVGVRVPGNRSRRFVVDDDDEEEEEEEEEVNKRDRGFSEVHDIETTSEEEMEEGEVDDDDVVGKALQKCARISAELKGELYGSAAAACDRYAEVEASSVKIVNQNDIDAACLGEDSDFQPVLKPYQMVGVNFLLLLYRKGIGGGHLSNAIVHMHKDYENWLNTCRDNLVAKHNISTDK